MSTPYALLVIFLFLNLLAGVWRLVRGPSNEDRILTAQLFGTITVMILLLLSQEKGNDTLLDAALLFASLSAVTVIAFIQSSDRGRS